MVYIPGSNNGTWGMGMAGAYFPENLGGPLGSPGNDLVLDIEFPDPKYTGPSFNFGQVLLLSPNGMSTNGDSSGYFYGTSKHSKRSKKNKRRSKSRRGSKRRSVKRRSVKRSAKVLRSKRRSKSRRGSKRRSVKRRSVKRSAKVLRSKRRSVK
jgi:hypothetical protein